MNLWRAGCVETRTSGSEGGPRKRTGRKPGTALRPDPYTKLKGPAKWTYYYLYVILDVFSRYAVGWTVQHRESSQVATDLIAQVCQQQQIGRDQLTVHADREPRAADARDGRAIVPPEQSVRMQAGARRWMLGPRDGRRPAAHRRGRRAGLQHRGVLRRSALRQA